MYGLVRVTETFHDGGSGSKEKFCCVKWAPDDGPADQRTPELQVRCSAGTEELLRSGRLP